MSLLSERLPYVFYPAGYFSGSYDSLGAWVRYVKSDVSHVQTIERNSKWIHLRAPDRELLIVRNTNEVAADRPFGRWDEFVPFSWHNSVSNDHGFCSHFMINYTSYAKSPRSNTNLRGTNSLIRNEHVVLADSGGFQIITGKEDWVNPDDLGRWASNNVDQVMTLDVIPHDHDDINVVKRSAAIQRKNTEVIKSVKSPELQLFNVVQGRNGPQSVRHHDLVMDESLDHVAAAGLYFGGVIDALHRAYCMLTDPNTKQYKQYHFLGIFNNTVLSPLIRMAALFRKQGKTFLISSDASSAIKYGMVRTMVLQRNHYRNLEQMDMGKAAPLYFPNAQRQLACSCPVCSTFKYADLISHEQFSVVSSLLISHNVGAMNRWCNMMTEYALELDSKQYKELVTKQFARSSGLKSVLMALEFVEALFEYGPAVAIKRYESIVDNKGLFKTHKNKSEGFDSDRAQEDEVALEGDPAEANERKVRFERIYAMFEKFHAGEKLNIKALKSGVPERKIDKNAKNFVTKNVSSGRVKRVVGKKKKSQERLTVAN